MFSLLSFNSKRSTSGAGVHGYATVAVRTARLEDEAALRRLAALDEKAVPEGHVLVAEADGEIVAAYAIGGEAVADPFRWTSDLVDLMKLRADQLQAGEWISFPGTAGGIRAVPRTA